MSKNSEKTVEIFENAPIQKAVFVNIIPSVISMLMVLVYNLADTFFIGQTNNDAMVAAVSLATPAFLFFMAVGMLFGIGGTSLISRLLIMLSGCFFLVNCVAVKLFPLSVLQFILQSLRFYFTVFVMFTPAILIFTSVTHRPVILSMAVCTFVCIFWPVAGIL